MDEYPRWPLRLAWFSVLAFVVLLFLYWDIKLVNARDLGQWTNTDPDVRAWYQSLKMPDIPTASCCGEADAYWCDEVHIRDGKAFCNITDDRDDAPRGRPHIDIGTEIEIPPEKLNKDPNPTGHAIVFLSRGLFVYCFVSNGSS